MGQTLSPRVTDAEDAHTTNRRSVREALVEVITRGERRRIWTPEQKHDIVMESLEPGGSPIAVARRHGIVRALSHCLMTRRVCPQDGACVTSRRHLGTRLLPPDPEGLVARAAVLFGGQ